MSRLKRGLLVSGLILAALVAVLTYHWADSGKDRVAHRRHSDLRSHPLYSSYNFDRTGGVLHLGIQPFWIFEGNVAEIMKRDVILNEGLKDLGFRIRFHSFLKGHDVGFFTRNGDLDAGVAGDMSTLSLLSEGKAVAVASVGNGFSSIVGRGFFLVKDLKHKKIGYAPGSSAHHGLLEALASGGVPAAEVEMVPMDGVRMPEAVKRGQVDAVATWEPITSVVLKENPGKGILHRARYLGFLFFSRDFAEANPDAVRKVVASLIRARRWLSKDRRNLLLSSGWTAEAGKALAPNLWGMDGNKISRLVAETDALNASPAIPEQDLREDGHLYREFEFLKSTGRIPVDAEWKTVRNRFQTDVAREVLKRPGAYRLNVFYYETE